jgi:tetraacyldisaccharide 4'-kinase
VTTRKDIVRIPPVLRPGIQVVSIALAWEDPAAIEALLDKALASQA